MSVRISFCVTCRGRFDHLRTTLPHNLYHEFYDVGGVEFVVLDYGDGPELAEWMDGFKRSLDAGALVYGRVNMGYYDSPHAKNVAHRLARGEVLVNLDADNLISKDFPAWLDGLFSSPGKLFARGMKTSLGGLIAVRREDWLSLGGYDERFGDGYGYDDANFVHRLEAAGWKPVIVPPRMAHSIPHPDIVRVQHMRRKDLRETAEEHARMTLSDLEEGRLVANGEGPYGAARVFSLDGRAIDLKGRPT